ncbi:superinfection immunity protein [Alkalimonas collagenimarina]|uniref:Superinfection immunity protein n=1 Tax=Alkalimonas collagenimarina TaxID=400390 RepID=A0ABT9GZW1_9GAMM|nr:superinfection immunity protein [Alkalimonas collagenimarina]MDP4536600.1 superinfection immunity protein [Alkalimonas collagenimarina]
MFESSEWVYLIEQSSVGFFIWFIPLFLFIYFVPTLIAVFFNRNHLGKIALANIPAGFSVIAWCALIGVAFSGKLLTKKSLEKTE